MKCVNGDFKKVRDSVGGMSSNAGEYVWSESTS